MRNCSRTRGYDESPGTLRLSWGLASPRISAAFLGVPESILPLQLPHEYIADLHRTAGRQPERPLRGEAGELLVLRDDLTIDRHAQLIPFQADNRSKGDKLSVSVDGK